MARAYGLRPRLWLLVLCECNTKLKQKLAVHDSLPCLARFTQKVQKGNENGKKERMELRKIKFVSGRARTGDLPRVRRT